MKHTSDCLLKYVGDEYLEENPTWHSESSVEKADDLIPLMSKVVGDHIKSTKRQRFSFADIGGGAGLVCRSLYERLEKTFPEIEINPSIYEVSPHAARMSRENNPEFSVFEKLLEANDAHYDAVLFVDVLEHIENPWESLRIAKSNAEYLVVRQPLLGNFPRFRHRDYEGQRNQWGHISYFSYWSFIDLAKATGWEPVIINLLAPWKLSGSIQRRPNLIKRIFIKYNRVLSSFFIDGFYLLGVFRSQTDADS